MANRFTLAVLYRMVYGRTLRRSESRDAILSDPLAGLGPIDRTLLADPEASETILRAVGDALAEGSFGHESGPKGRPELSLLHAAEPRPLDHPGTIPA